MVFELLLPIAFTDSHGINTRNGIKQVDCCNNSTLSNRAVELLN